MMMMMRVESSIVIWMSLLEIMSPGNCHKLLLRDQVVQQMQLKSRENNWR